jgi:hypothetical protein
VLGQGRIKRAITVAPKRRSAATLGNYSRDGCGWENPAQVARRSTQGPAKRVRVPIPRRQALHRLLRLSASVGTSPRHSRDISVGRSRATPIRVGIHSRYWSRNPYKAFRTAAELARWSGWSRPRRMSASISRSRNSMPRNRNPLRRRSRCRSMRTADVERDSCFVAGDSSAVPGS